MSENNYVEEVTIQDVTYKLRTRLGWQDLRKVDDKSVIMFAKRGSFERGVRDDEKELRVIPNSAEHDMARIVHRLIGKIDDGGKTIPINRNKLKDIPPNHFAVLIKYIENYEKEQDEEEKELMEENPTGLPSTD